MKPLPPSYIDRFNVCALCVLGGVGLALPAPLHAQTAAPPRATLNAAAPNGMLLGLQPIYLRAPILRYYTEPGDTSAPFAADGLALANLTVGENRRLYPDLARVRATVAKDAALGAFLQDARTGAALRQALEQTTLYACLPRRGLAGFNEYNALGSLPANLKPGRAVGRPGGVAAFGGQQRTSAEASGGQIGAPGAPGGSGSVTGTTQPGFLGDLQKVTPPAAGEVGPRIEIARQAALRDFSTLIVLSPDGHRANLYVMGSLPDSPNPAVGVNFTVEGKEYQSGDRDAAGVDHATNETLLDKQTLPPATAGARYFCFVYPLVTPTAGGQADLLVRYWPDTAVAVTHGVALAHSDTPQSGETLPAAQWITIPMTRLQYFQVRKSDRHALLAGVEPGDPLVDVKGAPRRAMVAGRNTPRKINNPGRNVNPRRNVGASYPGSRNRRRNNRYP